MSDAFVKYVAERQSIHSKRMRGQARPWTTDPTLHRAKFCCVIRDDDRTSREARDVILSLPPSLQLGAALGFRLYNRVDTLIALRDGDALCGDAARVQAVFDAKEGGVISTVYKINVKGGLKNIPEIARMLARGHKKAGEFAPRKSGMYAAQAVRGLVGHGPFVAYQTMQDLRWIYGPYEDESEWCLLGIGAMRGLARLAGSYGDQKGWHERESRDMRGRVAEALGFAEAKDISPLTGPARRTLLPLLGKVQAETGLGSRFTMYELEHNLCEFDKYVRISTGEAKGQEYRPR